MPCKLAIFDFDGTLADSAAWFAGQLPALAKRHGFRAPSPEEIEQLRRRPTRDVVKALRVRPWKLPAIASDLRRRMASDIDGVHLFEGVPGMLEDLRSMDIVLAVVSSNAEANVRRVLGEAGSLIGTYSCGASLFGKADMFRRVMKTTRVGPGHAWGVGDELRDIAAAHAAGAPAMAVGWGYTPAEILAEAGPDALAPSLQAVPRLLGARHPPSDPQKHALGEARPGRIGK